MYELFKGEEADAPEDTLVLLEWWADAAALEAHLKSPHIQQERERAKFISDLLKVQIFLLE